MKQNRDSENGFDFKIERMKLNKMCVLQNITPRHKGRDHKQWGTFFKSKRGRKGEGSTPHIEIQNGIGIQNSMEPQYKQSPTGTDRDQTEAGDSKKHKKMTEHTLNIH